MSGTLPEMWTDFKRMGVHFDLPISSVIQLNPILSGVRRKEAK
jgi:hypothetical protein